MKDGNVGKKQLEQYLFLFFVSSLNGKQEATLGCACVCVCVLLPRHVKDSRRCSEIHWWACFITSHIETNLCPFTWRTASYSLTKLAWRFGVKEPQHTHTHTHSWTHTFLNTHSPGSVTAVCNISSPLFLLFCHVKTQMHNLCSCPSLHLLYTHTHPHTHCRHSSLAITTPALCWRHWM